MKAVSFGVEVVRCVRCDPQCTSGFFALCVFSMNLRDLRAVVFSTTEKRRAREKHGVVPLNLKVLRDQIFVVTKRPKKHEVQKEHK